jgi:hypothetical protein
MMTQHTIVAEKYLFYFSSNAVGLTRMPSLHQPSQELPSKKKGDGKTSGKSKDQSVSVISGDNPGASNRTPNNSSSQSGSSDKLPNRQ